MAGGQVVTEGQTAHREIEIVGYISQKEVSIHEAHRRITGLGGKVGSAHWPAKDQAHGSWHVNVHDADKWESHVVESSLNRDPATAPRTPPRCGERERERERESSVIIEWKIKFRLH